MDCKVFLFTHLKSDKKELGCSYWHRIGRNGGLAAAVVIGKESMVLFLEVGEGGKISYPFLDNPS